MGGGERTGWGTGLDWEIGTGRFPEGQMVGSGTALVLGLGWNTGEMAREELGVWALV